MREIKFRAWDRKNNIMEYDIGILHGRCVKWGCQWLNSENTVWNSDPMQFTGLHDKNGNEIYEGDILGGIYYACYIGFCEKHKSFELFFEGICGACDGDISWWEIVADEDLEVIGNIHENPEFQEVAE